MVNAAVDVTTIERIGHDEAMAITTVENRRFLEQLRSLDAGDWTRPTACDRWDVRAVVAHVVGSAVGQISPREFLRQVRAGRPVVREIGARYWWDGMNEVQVRERADLTGDELIAEWVGNADRARAARTRLPRPIGRWTWTPGTTVASSPTSSPSGRRPTVNRSSSSSPGPRAAPTARAAAATWSASTPSTSSPSWPAGPRAPACCAIPCPSRRSDDHEAVRR